MRKNNYRKEVVLRVFSRQKSDIEKIGLTKGVGFLYNLGVASADRAFSHRASTGEVQKGTSQRGDGPTTAC